MSGRIGRALLVVAVLALAGCSSGRSTGDSASGIDSATQTLLRRDVQALAVATAARNTAGARVALETLTADADAAHLAGKVSDGQYQSIQSAEAAVRVDLTNVVSSLSPTSPAAPKVSTAAPTTFAAPSPAVPTPAAPSPAATHPKPAPAPAKPTKQKGKGKGNGNGNGNGNG
ncbi:hypothetical protein SAMN05892883_2497 [Jatrophihabitans sp. GAS493]|uniref:hypothetical protein n=1 Tax=Jatrophihabitans sp. GAS493 TaxID=1907575 RepID=UPI000BB68FA0|nr:hypothetical protein [Jatrophihabitans sp. GAS493]SOD73206.1 hypothetical protein SAMN05892883_2497 [Jatrophihabitans sp. GAS493]